MSRKRTLGIAGVIIAVVALVIGVAFILRAISHAHTAEMNRFVATLQAEGFTVSTSGGKLAASWDSGSKAKTVKVGKRTVKIAQGTDTMEVVVIVPNTRCLVEMELSEGADPRTYWLDETRTQKGDEMDVPEEFNSLQRPGEVKNYLQRHRDQFAYCL